MTWVPYAVLAVIGSLGAWFWRSSKADAHRTTQLEAAESRLALAFKERQDLREKNALSLEIFDDVWRGCCRELGGLSADCDYANFVQTALGYVDRPLVDAHYLDRVVLKHGSLTRRDQMPLGFFLSVLALAVGGDPEGRATTLAQLIADPDDGQVAHSDAVCLIEWLILAGHVPPSALVYPLPQKKFPFQQHGLRTPEQLFQAAAAEQKFEQGESESSSKSISTFLTTEQFKLILLSKTLNLR